MITKLNSKELNNVSGGALRDYEYKVAAIALGAVCGAALTTAMAYVNNFCSNKATMLKCYAENAAIGGVFGGMVLPNTAITSYLAAFGPNEGVSNVAAYVNMEHEHKY